jgi:preprotein translocase subunit SecG
MLQILLIVQVVIALCMIGLVLIQHGKGADMGASFGAGASNTVFGSSGSTPFLVKITILFAVFYFANSLGIGYLTTQNKKASSTLNSTLLTNRPVTPVQGSDAEALSAAIAKATQETTMSISTDKKGS